MVLAIVLIPTLLLCAVSWICSIQHSYPGLQLCDGASSSYGAARCNSFAGGCQGAAYGNSSALNCYPNDVWSGTRASSTEYYDFPLDGGVMTRVLRPPVNAYSVRCVPDLDYSKQVQTLQLCDKLESSIYGAAQCDGLSGGCLGASPNPCWPHVLWGALVNTGMPSSAHFGKDILIISDTHISTYAFSVRCLLLALYGVSPLSP